MKFISQKTLESVIQSPNLLQKWGIKNILQCIFSVSNAMSYLEDNLIIHGNLCPSNIIFDEPDKFYVCDFGLYPIKELYLNEEKVFHKIYKDPSMKNNEPSFKTDVYSFGVLMCQLFLLYFHFEKDNTIISNDILIEFISSSTRSKCEEIQIPKDFITLIQSCINSKAFDRPTFKKINESFKSMKTMKDKEEEINISKLYNEFTDPNYLLKEPSETDSTTLLKLGKLFRDKSEKEYKRKAAELYKKAADLNNPEAQYYYGELIKDLEKDNKEKMKEGAKYLKMSAEKGVVKGMMNIGLDFYKGEGVKKDPKKAEEYTKKAADLGFSEAQANYAYIHIMNNPTPERINEGLIYLRKAMDYKDDEAYCIYAYFLKRGVFLEKNDKLAMHYFKKAADMENEDAMFEYALGNELGIGVPMNINVAMSYYYLAASKGNEEAKIKLNRLTKNISSTKSRKKKNDSTPITFNDQLIEDDVKAEIIKILDIDLPFQASSKVSLISLGKVVYDRPNYHTESYIYPVGYQIEREYFSIDDPRKSAVYRATILDGGDSPLFKVECLDKSKMIFSGNSPSYPWIEAIDEIQKSREKYGILKCEKIGISGPKFFGLLIHPVEYLIDHLPNVDKCTKYVHKKLFVRGVDKEIKDGKEVVFLNYKGNNENVKTKRSFGRKRKKKSKSYRKKNNHNIDHSNRITNQIEPNEPPNIDNNNENDLFEQDEPKADESKNNNPYSNDNKIPSSDQNDNEDNINEHNNHNSSEIEQDNANTNDIELSSSEQNDSESDIMKQYEQKNYQNSYENELQSSDQNDNEDDINEHNNQNSSEIEQDNANTNDIENPSSDQNEIGFQSSYQNDSDDDNDDNNIEQDEQTCSEYDEYDEYDLSEMIYNFNKPVDELIRIADELYDQGSLERAYRYYKEAANRGFPEAHIKCAEISPSLEDMIEHYELAISNNVHNSFIKFRSFIFKKAFSANYKDKKSYFAQLFEKYEDFSDAAFLYDDLKDEKNFKICYEKAIKKIKNVEDGDQLYHFGLVARKQKDLDLSLFLFTKAKMKGSEKAKKEIEKIES